MVDVKHQPATYIELHHVELNSTMLLSFQCKLISYTLTKSIPDVNLLFDLMSNIFLNGSVNCNDLLKFAKIRINCL